MRPWRQEPYRGEKWRESQNPSQRQFHGHSHVAALRTETPEYRMCLNTARRDLSKQQKVSIKNTQKTDPKKIF